ncbi:MULTISPECIES: hypothetical protein [Wolbachia]|uniref:hypothetical protein n=1 Tax=Wolbachia TaxID=953 RepID=UPI00004CA28E|nr:MULTISPECIES: hypothetical protein [Wolbachia]MDX5488332.1 hypothetical protein [Wolbachia endosymbiont of Andrena praecox]MDX5497677.1 hypothetical protein [Wolbachia endosymbiont of Lasioglossum nitidulum]MDX5543476.1 hypothetical protein [Wolbachia endosymbiont of Andrena apicata]MDX5561571.1 hypothetical protein [Wolbachia endosymbiont of Andrena bicolor]MDX5596773.1 hypothetical protein [Wolbachia endosymbiont of Andrena labialis]
MESSNSMFFDTDYPELRKAISDIIESIAQSSQEGKKELFTTLSEQVKGMNLKDLGLAINDQGLQKEVNKELFIKLIEEALKDLTSENVDSKIIEEALKSVNQQAISNVINNNKGPLDNLVNYFKSASANKKIGIASAVMVLGAAFSPLIVLATLIALVAIGARYVGIGIGRAGEKIKEGAIETGKAVKSSYKDLIDKLPTVQARENNFSRLRTNVLETIANISLKDNKNVDTKKGFDDGKKILEMLQNEGQRSAIQELVKNGTIQNFSKDDMSRLLEKGLSTHVADMKALNDLINKFQPVIMAIGSDIKEVEQKVNEKAQEMKPNSHLGISSAARVSEGGITGPS